MSPRVPPKFLVNLLAPHFAHPRGVRGRIVAAIMNRGNRRMNAFTVDALELSPKARVADVGFGGGLSLAPLAQRVTDGQIVGIDPSPTMVARGRSRFASLVSAGRLRLLDGTIEKLPLEDAAVDALMSVNTVYFWTDPAAAVREIARVLVPSGRVALTFLPTDRMDAIPTMFPPAIFTRRDPADIEALLRDAGFRDVRTHQASGPGLGAWCSVLGRK